MATSGRRKRVTKSPEDRREDILRAGERVFGTVGFTEATIVDLAEAAEIGKGTFYLYFDSKDHLLGALWERYVDTIVDIAQRILAEGADRWTTVDSVLTAIIEYAVQNAELHRIVYGSANAKALELCKHANQRVIGQMCAYVEAGAAEGVFEAIDPAEAFRMVYHALDGLLDDRIATREPIATDALVRQVLQLAHRALGDARTTRTPGVPAEPDAVPGGE